MNPFDLIYDSDIESLNRYLEVNDINVVDKHHCSLLITAIKLGNNEIFKLLLKNYIDLSIQDDKGFNAYHYAVICNRFGYLKTLLSFNNKYYLDLDFKGRNAIYLSGLYGRYEMFYLFREVYPFSLDIYDSNHESLFMALVRSKNMKLITENYDSKYLELENYLGQTPLFIATDYNSLLVMNFLIGKGAFVNHKDHFGQTPIFLAINNKHYKAVEMLIANGAIFDLKDRFSYDLTSKMAEYEEILSKYNYQQYIKEFPLHYGIIKNDESIISNNLNISSAFKEDHNGFSPLELTRRYKNKELEKRIYSLHKESIFLMKKIK